MIKRIVMVGLLSMVVVGFAATSAFAYSCPKLIAAGRRLAASASMGKAEALRLLSEAEAAHKAAVKAKNVKGHILAVKKAAQAIAMLSK